MIDFEYMSVINAIKNKMALEKVIWTKTSSTNQFKLLLNESTIVIDRWNSSNLGELVRFDIINNNGDIIGRIMYVRERDPEDFNILLSFYYEVVNYYNQTTKKTLSNVLNEINSSDTVGRLDKELMK